MNDLIDPLKQIGLNTYEAKVYLALLKQHPATGYEVSKIAQLPQARVYDTLKSLEHQNIVVAASQRPVTYIPTAPDELLSRYERQYQGAINFLRSALPNYSVESVEPVHNLRGEAAILDHVRHMIDTAQDTIFIELWQEDADRLQTNLHAAVDRGV